jgi:hypothetical protein
MQLMHAKIVSRQKELREVSFCAFVCFKKMFASKPSIENIQRLANFISPFVATLHYTGCSISSITCLRGHILGTSGARKPRLEPQDMSENCCWNCFES